MIPKPERFCVVYADPGMEKKDSYRFCDWAERECKSAGIPFLRTDSESLYNDLLTAKTLGKKRLDKPPFWTKGEDGSCGKLQQSCTAYYKIEPIKRAIRNELFRVFGISTVRCGAGLSSGCVEQWIGFTADEGNRVESCVGSPRNAKSKYLRLGFPLVGMGLTKADVFDLYEDNGWEVPPRSMCNACPYHGLRSLKDMHDNRPDDWAQAVKVDEAVRDMSFVGVKNPCFVSETLIPLTQLAEIGFKLADPIRNDLAQCPSGACFI
jgi:hypothetical protein